MKKMISLVTLCAMMAFGVSLVRAEGTETTLKGTMKCAKCSLKEADKCQAVLVVKEGDKEVEYHLKDNAIGKAAHKEICKADKENVSVTGVVSEKDGKKIIAASKVE